ncbi:MAG TPA: protein kinase [Myxococcaceae bacterium]|nr:protein kinase [Myxococcaceae bacterium]
MAKIGKYELVRKLASGGMAEVFLAKFEWAYGLEKTVVVKRILQHLHQDPNFIAMFFSEAQLASRLDHPNIVQIIEFGESEDANFLAMEYVDGLTLRDLLVAAYQAGEFLPFGQCASIVAHACEALAYAHELTDPATGVPMKLVHRDVSLDNIIVSKAGAVKLMDFGIAKAVNQAHHTKTGVIKGKLSYMSPEQIRAQPLDRRVDVYGLGVVLYELVTGAKPFDNLSEAELLHEIVYGERIPMRERRKDAPPELERITTRALERDKERRYPDCRMMHADLESFLRSWHQPVNAFELAELIKRYSGDAKAGSGPVEIPPTRAAPEEASDPDVTAPRAPPPRATREASDPDVTGARPPPSRAREVSAPDVTGERPPPEANTVMERPRVGAARAPSGGKPRSTPARPRVTSAELASLIRRRPMVAIPVALGAFAAALALVLLVRNIPERPVAPPPTHPAQPTPTATVPPPTAAPDPAEEQARAQDELERSEKDQAKARELLANATPLLGGSDPGSAEPLLMACLQLDPTNADCHLTLSTMYVQLKNRTQARAHALKFLKLAPDRAAEAQPIFQDLQAMKVRAAPPKPVRAPKTTKTPVARDTKDPPKEVGPDPNDPSNQELSTALCEEGKQMLRQKQYKQASALFNSCLNLDKRNADCNLGLGSAWANLGSQAKAAKYYREFLRLAPNHPLAGDVKVLLQQYEGQQ